MHHPRVGELSDNEAVAEERRDHAGRELRRRERPLAAGSLRTPFDWGGSRVGSRHAIRGNVSSGNIAGRRTDRTSVLARQSRPADRGGAASRSAAADANLNRHRAHTGAQAAPQPPHLRRPGNHRQRKRHGLLRHILRNGQQHLDASGTGKRHHQQIEHHAFWLLKQAQYPRHHEQALPQAQQCAADRSQLKRMPKRNQRKARQRQRRSQRHRQKRHPPPAAQTPRNRNVRQNGHQNKEHQRPPAS